MSENNSRPTGLVRSVRQTTSRDKLASIIAIIPRSHHSFPKGRRPFVSANAPNLSLSLPLYFSALAAPPAERRRLASCDSGAADAISIGRYNEWVNRRESTDRCGFCNQRPESPATAPRILHFIAAQTARERRQSLAAATNSDHLGTARYMP